MPISPVSDLADLLRMGPDALHDLFLTALVILLVVLVRWLGIRLVERRFDNPRAHYLAGKYLSYTSLLLGIFLVGRIWFEGFSSLLTFLGLVSAGVAIALRDVLLDMAAWIYLITRKPFELGDRIEINGVQGDVIDKRVLQFSVMEIGNWVDADQSTGRVVHIPNHHIFNHHLANYSQGFAFIWHEIPVRLSFESDWRKAKGILQHIVEKHASEITPEAARQMRESAKQFMIIATVLTPTVYTEVREWGVQLTLRYLTHPRRRRGSAQMIWEDILSEFANHPDITFAYPTTRYVATNPFPIAGGSAAGERL